MSDSPLRKKNPLAVLFGQALRYTRNRERKSSEEVVSDLSIGESAYRLVESGGAILQPRHTFGLIKVLQTLVWRKVVMYIAWIEASDSQVSEDLKIFWDHARNLAALDTGLEELANRAFRPMWDAAEGAADRHDDPPAACVEALRVYLESDGEPRQMGDRHTSPDGARTNIKTLSEWASVAPEMLSPIHIDSLLQQIETLQYFPTTVSLEQFALWERRNYRVFANVWAYANDLNELLGTAGDFYWDYLQFKDFGTLTILTPALPHLEVCGVTEVNMDDWLAERLCRSVLKSTKSRSKPSEQSLANKIRRHLCVRLIPSQVANRIIKMLRYDRAAARLLKMEEKNSFTPLDNVWIYELTRYGTEIGFADDYRAGKKDFIITTLTKGEVAKVKSLITSIIRERP